MLAWLSQVAVLLLFLITEVPQGVLGLLSGILGHCFFRNCYHQLGEFMDILALLNGAINFILYCSMSRQFRDTFSKMFKPQILAKCTPPTDIQSTYVWPTNGSEWRHRAVTKLILYATFDEVFQPKDDTRVRVQSTYKWPRNGLCPAAHHAGQARYY